VVRLYNKRESHPGLALPIVALQAILTARYLVWRGTSTLNWETPAYAAISLALYAAEAWGFSSLVLFYFQTLWPKNRKASPLLAPDAYPSVDVFVTIYDEPVEVLYRTLVGCETMTYPKGKKRIYVLDDGSRDEVRALAERFGVGYIRRADNRHAKAGNLNHALPMTKGEIIFILDADHVPVRGALKQLVGHFRDPKVALVQAPHHFYNPDAYQRNLNLEREVSHEQDLFFHVIEPGCDRFNSAFFAGTAGMLRRAALEQVGGFRTESLIEDTYTSMELHSRGWKSAFVPYPVAAGLSPETFPGYVRQRRRWCRGGVQIFTQDNPLLKPGLSIMQRVLYFASLSWFFGGIPRIVFLLAPLPFLLMGVCPIVAPVWELTAYFLPFYLAQLAAFAMVSRDYRHPFWSDVYEAATAFTLTRTALSALLRTGGSGFEVTPKGVAPAEERLDWSYVFPHLVILGTTLLGCVLGLFHLFTGGLQWDATVLSFGWAGYNCVLLGAAVHVARERAQVRASHRVPRRVRCDLRFDGGEASGWTTDLSETGSSVLVEGYEHFPKYALAKLTAEDGQTSEVPAEIVRSAWTERGHTSLGLKFDAWGEGDRRGILRILFTPDPTWDAWRRPKASFSSSLAHVFRSAFRTFLKRPAPPGRRFPRLRAAFPCRIRTDEGVLEGRTLDLSSTGLSVRLSEEVPTGTKVALAFDTAKGEIKATGIVVRELGEKLTFGIRLIEPDHLNLHKLSEALEPAHA